MQASATDPSTLVKPPEPTATTSACCPYCRGRQGEVVYRGLRDRLAYVPGTWSFWRCDGCGSLIQHPLPQPEDLAGYYPPVYCYNPQVSEGTRLQKLICDLEWRWIYRPLYRADARKIARGVGSPAGAGKRLLDVGCGRALRLVALRDLGFDVVGMDFQPETVETLKKQYNIPAVCCDVGGISQAFAPHSFDVVTGFYVMEHVVDPAQSIGDCLQLVKPGGWLVVAVPLADSVQSIVFKDRWCQVREAPRHVTIPSRQAMHSLGRALGCDRVFLVPDTARSGAASLALTLLPSATTYAAYGRSRLGSVALRCLGSAIAAVSLPWCWAENVIFRRPVCGLLFMRKSPEPGTAAAEEASR